MSGWTEVAKTAEFSARDRKLVEVAGRRIGIFKLDEGYFAVDAYCSHEKALIVEGEVTGREIQCPIHGARFDLKTGRNLSLPAVRPIRRYEVRVDGDSIRVNV